MGLLNVIVPAPLRAGGTIGICAPSGPVDPARLNAAIAALRASGFDVQTSASAFSRSGYLSATDDVRARELEEMFVRDDIDAVICARGGVGASRLLEILDTARIAGHPKPFLGFSDNTALQWLLWGRHRLVSFSGPMAVDWSGLVSEHTLRLALDVLMGDAPTDLLNGFSRDGIHVLRGTGSFAGTLLPGNLTMINTLLGTPYLPALDGTLLLIEDVNEPPYRIDRMLFHLRNAGVLSRIGGLLCGDLDASADEAERALVRQAVLDAMRGTSCPIVTGLPFGHGRDRMTLPVGGTVHVNLDTLTLALRAAVTPEPSA